MRLRTMKTLRNNLHKWWYLYLISLVLLPFLSWYLVHTINLPRNEETFSVFIASCDTSTSALRFAFEKKKPSYLRETTIRSYVYFENSFQQYYSISGKNGSDVVILPESKIVSETVIYYYEKLDSLFPIAEKETYFIPKGMSSPYGIRIHSKEEKENNLIAYSDDTHNEDYYIFFKKGSCHLKEPYKTISIFLGVLREENA